MSPDRNCKHGVLLDAEQAASWLQEHYGFCSKASLAKHRHMGSGPKFILLGRFPRYTTEWLQEWVDAQLSTTVFTSTREYHAA